MKLWLISQTINKRYDTYDSAVVAAETESEAQRIYPDGFSGFHVWRESDGRLMEVWDGAAIEATANNDSWVLMLTDVKVKYIGDAAPDTPAGVIVASFNADAT